jgi:glycosyltransferase involved in cell wall biosynthesis
MSKDIGICVSTCDRPDYLKKCIDSLQGVDAEICICDDGHKKVDKTVPNNIHILKTKTPRSGVAVNKNLGLKYLLEKGCKYIFALEDDCIIIDQAVFNKYIEASKKTGIQHFNFGPGSPWNRRQDDPSLKGDLSKRMLAKQDGKPAPRLIASYDPEGNTEICLYEHVVGMLSFFTREGLEKVGLYDEDFYNAWEHVEHTYRFILADMTTPFWWFADIKDSEKYIKGQENEKANSSLSKNEDEFNKLVHEGLIVFRNKHNIVPGEIRSVTKQKVYESLRKIKDKK